MREMIVNIDCILVQVRRMMERQRQSPKTLNEQIQRKLTENGIHKDELSKNMTVRDGRKILLIN